MFFLATVEGDPTPAGVEMDAKKRERGNPPILALKWIRTRGKRTSPSSGVEMDANEGKVNTSHCRNGHEQGDPPLLVLKWMQTREREGFPLSWC